MSARKRRRLTIPLLVKLVGPEKADQLRAEWGGHDVPQMTELELARRRRDQELRAFVDQTGSFSEAAQQFGISTRHAKRIANSG